VQVILGGLIMKHIRQNQRQAPILTIEVNRNRNHIYGEEHHQQIKIPIFKITDYGCKHTLMSNEGCCHIRGKY